MEFPIADLLDEELSTDWTNPRSNQRLRDLKVTLEALETWQRKVAIVSNFCLA